MMFDAIGITTISERNIGAHRYARQQSDLFKKAHAMAWRDRRIARGPDEFGGWKSAPCLTAV